MHTQVADLCPASDWFRAERQLMITSPELSRLVYLVSWHSECYTLLCHQLSAAEHTGVGSRGKRNDERSSFVSPSHLLQF